MSRSANLLIIFLLVLSTSLLNRSFAWNRPTYMVTGAIAYRDLQTTSPQLAVRVVAILRQHPEFQPRWAGKLNDPALSDDERDQYLFMLAARWPDDVRGNAYDHPTWHYINYVYAP